MVGLAFPSANSGRSRQAEEDGVGARRHHHQVAVLDPEPALGQHQRAGLGPGALSGHPRGVAPLAWRPLQRSSGERQRNSLLGPLGIGGYGTHHGVERAPFAASVPDRPVDTGVMPQEGADGRMEAPQHRDGSAGSLRRRVLIAALAAIAPLWSRPAPGIASAVDLGRGVPAACHRGRERDRPERDPAAASRRRGGRGHPVPAEPAGRGGCGSSAGPPRESTATWPLPAATTSRPRSSSVRLDQAPVATREAARVRGPRGSRAL